MEMQDLYSAQRQLTGATLVRGEVIPRDSQHLVVHVWLRNSRGEHLISQRSADRASFPLMWECTGGSVLKGEDSLSGAVREVWEELGIQLFRQDGKLLFSQLRDMVNGEYFGDIMDVWLFPYDGTVFLEKAATKEVSQAAWLTVEEIRELFESGKLVPTLDYFFCTEELINDATAV